MEIAGQSADQSRRIPEQEREMQFYPFGVAPTEYPDWYAKPLAAAGIDPAHSKTWILSGNPDETRLDSPSAYLLTMPPGYTLFRHGHPCFRFEVIIQGSLEVGDGTVAKVGDVFTAQPGELYGLGGEYDVRKGEVPPGYQPTSHDLDLMPAITRGRTAG